MAVMPQGLEHFPEAPAGVTIDRRIDGIHNIGIAIRTIEGTVKRCPG